MSKKLIAVASAAALALTALVAVPATATTIASVTVTDVSNNTANTEGTVRASHTEDTEAFTASTWASARNVVFGNSTDAATRTAIRFVVKTGTGTTVTVNSTAGVKVATTLTSAGSAIKVTDGATSLSGTTTSGSDASLSYTFYAWSTSTTAGTVVIETPGSKSSYFVKGTLGPAYDIKNVTFPSLYKGQTDGKITYTLADAYGNAVTEASTVDGDGFGVSYGSNSYSSTTKLWTLAVDEVTEENAAIQIAMPAFDANDYTLNGFAKPVRSAFALISAADLATQVTALTAQVADLQAQLDASRLKVNSVTKKRWNNLVLRHRALGGSAKLK